MRVRLPDGRRAAQTCSTEAEADELRKALLYELNQLVETLPSTVPSSRWLLRTWGAHWLDARETQRAIRDTNAERSMWARYVLKSPIADVSLEDIRARDVRAYLSSLLSHRKEDGKGLRILTVKKALTMLRKCLGDAVREELIASNPAAGVEAPKRRGDSTEGTFLSAAEVEAVVTCEAIPERERCIFTVAIFTGLRAGELWALQWGDVQLEGERPEITVRRSHRHAPKNGKVQSVPLLEPALVALQRAHALAESTEPDALVFPTKRGHQRERGDDAGWSTRKRKLGKVEPGLQELAGIKRRVRFHDLRHTCASHLVMGTWGRAWSLGDVAKMLRHSSVTVTERYAHLAPGYLHEQARQTARAAAPSVAPELPPLVEQASVEPPAVTHSPGSEVAPPARIERATNALGKRFCVPGNPSQSLSDDPCVTHALALLLAVDEGAPVGEHLEALVSAVLAGPAVSLALRIREGGPLRVRLAVELAGIVLSALSNEATVGRVA